MPAVRSLSHSCSWGSITAIPAPVCLAAFRLLRACSRLCVLSCLVFRGTLRATGRPCGVGWGGVGYSPIFSAMRQPLATWRWRLPVLSRAFCNTLGTETHVYDDRSINTLASFKHRTRISVRRRPCGCACNPCPVVCPQAYSQCILVTTSQNQIKRPSSDR
jgi:hypothetical protein